MKKIIEKARIVQRERYRGSGIALNGQMDDHLAQGFCRLGKDGEDLLASAYRRLGLNPRTLLKVKKIARTIADMEESEEIKGEHVAEALQYRGEKT